MNETLKRREDLSPEERNNLLRKADHAYLRSEIDMAEYDRLNEIYGVDFGAVFAEMTSLRRWALHLIERVRYGSPPASGQ